MNDPTSTGWTFTGSYTTGLNAVNCPGGSGDKCARLGGNEASTTIDSEMVITIDVSQYVNLNIQYDWALSTMPSGKLCRLDYAFDDNSFSLAQYRISSGTTVQTYLNETYTVPDHVDAGYTNLSIKFWNNALYNNEYCYIDHFYLFGDYLIEFDGCDVADSSWTFQYSSITTSNCFSTNCIFMGSTSYFATKQYSNINMYNNLVLRADFYTSYQCSVYYSYDSEPETILASFGRSSPAPSTTSMSPYANQEVAIPDAEICGATLLFIKFKPYYSVYDCNVDNVVLWGNVLDTAYPTTSPTQIPTAHPTSSTNGMYKHRR